MTELSLRWLSGAASGALFLCMFEAEVLFARQIAAALFVITSALTMHVVIFPAFWQGGFFRERALFLWLGLTYLVIVLFAARGDPTTFFILSLGGVGTFFALNALVYLEKRSALPSRPRRSYWARGRRRGM